MTTLWFILGIIGGIFFFGRFYWQWLVSEYRGEYTVPLSFWYMSAAGALLLFGYAYERGSSGGTFGLCLNIIIYARNIAYVWKERGWLTPTRSAALHGAAGLVSLVAVALTVVTWRNEYQPTNEYWIWALAWGVGQILFFARFGWQWLETEVRGKSVITAPFWYLSLAGLVLHGAYFTHRADWLLAIGTVADGIPYARNLVLLRRARNRATDSDATE